MNSKEMDKDFAKYTVAKRGKPKPNADVKKQINQSPSGSQESGKAVSISEAQKATTSLSPSLEEKKDSALPKHYEEIPITHGPSTPSAEHEKVKKELNDTIANLQRQLSIKDEEMIKYKTEEVNRLKIAIENRDKEWESYQNKFRQETNEKILKLEAEKSQKNSELENNKKKIADYENDLLNKNSSINHAVNQKDEIDEARKNAIYHFATISNAFGSLCIKILNQDSLLPANLKDLQETMKKALDFANKQINSETDATTYAILSKIQVIGEALFKKLNVERSTFSIHKTNQS